MPTGYTALIENGKAATPKDFLKVCIRAFGVCVDLRDEDLDLQDVEAKLKESCMESINYHRERLVKAEEKLKEFDAKTDDEVMSLYLAQKVDKDKDYILLYNEAVEKNKTYEKFLAAIKDWKPAAEYQKIKEFALEQITISMDKDPGYWLRQMQENDVQMDVAAVRKELRDDLLYDVNYHRKEYEEATDRMEKNLTFYRGFIKELEKFDA